MAGVSELLVLADDELMKKPWRVGVFLKRFTHGPLKSPCFHIFGHPTDLEVSCLYCMLHVAADTSIMHHMLFLCVLVKQRYFLLISVQRCQEPTPKWSKMQSTCIEPSSHHISLMSALPSISFSLTV